MLCSNCGYENPREHRYCGMCGTPFPYRALTVPEAQSTLAFSSAPLEATALPVPSAGAEPAAPQVAEPPRPAVEPSPVERIEVAVPQVEAASQEPSTAASEEPVPVVPEVAEHPEPARAEAEPAAAEAEPEPAVEKPAAAVHKPAARVVVMPTPRSYPQTGANEPPAAKPFVPHPSPDAQTFTLPPASAGMPTFQEVAEAAGAPTISPFEPPAEKHTDEDSELQEYIASFRYTPPAETADELTMRSEAPVIDQEAPAEFHHPSFDDDVPPPPEAGPHPTGEEYYSPEGTTERPHFLEIGDTKPHWEEGAYPAILAAADIPPVKSRGWLWTTIAALVVLFGGLGFWEGRAQSTHAFLGPVEIARDVYDRLRQQLARINEPAATAPESHAPDSATQPEVKPSAAAQPAEKTQPDVAAQSSEPTATPAQPANHDQATSKPMDAATAATNMAAKQEVAKSEPPKAIQPPPPPKPTGKPQPGQQEFDKALNASDPTAAAAWLWKATSRGNPEAPVRLADMYIKGNGVPKSCEQAMVLLRSAATKDNAPARNRLAALYANGTCVARDRVKAYQFMSSALAADPSSDWAKQNREQLWSQMTPQERSEAQKYR